MLKIIALIPRRADLTRADFRNYYETRHTPLALQYFRTFGKYLRNHLAPDAPADLPFDVMSEFWFKDAAGPLAAQAFLASPAGAIIREDEERFMKRSGILSIVVDEHLLAGPPRVVESDVVPKQAFFIRRRDDADPAQFISDVRQYVAPAAPSAHRVTLDLPKTGDGSAPRNPVVDAVVSVWPKRAGAGLRLGPKPGTFASCIEAWVDAHETPTARLSDDQDFKKA